MLFRPHVTVVVKPDQVAQRVVRYKRPGPQMLKVRTLPVTSLNMMAVPASGTAHQPGRLRAALIAFSVSICARRRPEIGFTRFDAAGRDELNERRRFGPGSDLNRGSTSLTTPQPKRDGCC